jgi:alkane 1-monooxygenase
MHPIQSLAFLVYTAVTVFALQRPEFLWLPAVFVFVGIPLIDLVMGVDKTNPSDTQEAIWKKEIVWAPALYLYALTHFMVLGLGVSLAFELPMGWDLLLLALVVGLYTGGLGITVGHELCHKKEFAPRLVANLILSSVWYQHFAVEHVRGHHLLVSTPDDPASARYNENVYVFVVRSVVTSFLHALKIDSKAVWGGVVMSVLFTLSAVFLSQSVLVFFLAQSVVAFVLLELVNYLEHYGLVRKKNVSGRYEKVTPIHSWNSAHKFSNLLLFNLQRHSDHHALAHLPYTVLKHHDQAPQLPSGYPGMILLALVPPLWFKVMNPKVKAWESQISTSA